MSENLTIHVVHETRFMTSRLLYVGTDKEEAFKHYRDSDEHVTMETAGVNVDLDELEGRR